MDTSSLASLNVPDVAWPAGWPIVPTLSILALLALSALLSASEAALLNVNRYRLRNLVRLGNRSARRAELLLAQPDRLATTILLCKIFVNTSAAVLSGSVALRAGGGPALAAAIAILTLLLLTLGETVPRAYGALHPERLALPASWIYSALLRVLHPLVWPATALSNMLLRVFGVSSTAARSLSLGAARGGDGAVSDDNECHGSSGLVAGLAFKQGTMCAQETRVLDEIRFGDGYVHGRDEIDQIALWHTE